MKVSAPLVFADGNEYNRQCSGKRFLKCVLRHTGRGTDDGRKVRTHRVVRSRARLLGRVGAGSVPAEVVGRAVYAIPRAEL